MSAEVSERMTAPAGCVKVRMYRVGGLGDCFLLAFGAGNGSTRYMLVDCGVFLGTRGGADRMRAIARDIERATGGHLHVVVVTHEHWDHVAGFHYAREDFERMQIDEAWLAWTEHPTHPLAVELREKRGVALKALQAAVTRLQAASDPQAEQIEAVLGFHGEFDALLGASRTAGQIDWVRDRAASVRYLRPSELPLHWEDVPDVRLFVLGPPEDAALLNRSEPTGNEVYEVQEPLDAARAFSAAALAAAGPQFLSPDDRELLDRSRPFDRSLAIPLQQAGEHEVYGEFFRQYYGFSDADGHGPAWRRIDVDWLGTAGSLALDLDNDTNNTSLVLAIELRNSGGVLLFPGDAQVGSWLSWHELSWPEEGMDPTAAGGGPGGAPVVTGPDLLRRTVLYKVSHHGSHNATLRAKGLEMMQSPNLVALVPVDEDQAQRKRWQMPFEQLFERLQEKTGGRILRSDRGTPEKPGSIPDGDWQSFARQVVEDPGPDKLWIEFTVQ